MAKVTLDIEYEYDFKLIGISSHVKDYRVCWAINNALEFNFERIEDVEVRNKNLPIINYSQYFYSNEDLHLDFTLISNRGINKYMQGDSATDTLIPLEKTSEMLIPEQKQADYLLMIKGGFTKKQENELIKKLKEIDLVLTVFPIDVDSLRSKQNLLF